MSAPLDQALAVGYERLQAWAGLLDRINVFPVADGDTGRNLVASLGPLRRHDLQASQRMRALRMGARGNSGNIAVQFLAGFLDESAGDTLLARSERGAARARAAVAQPKPGTMLSFFDALVSALERRSGTPDESEDLALLVDELAEAVRRTRDQLPRLQAAGVVDSGALGMQLFFEGVLAELSRQPRLLRLPTERFAGLLDPGPLSQEPEDGVCVDAVLEQSALEEPALRRALAALGHDVVAQAHGEQWKIHLHAQDAEQVRAQLEGLGRLRRFASDDLGQQTRSFGQGAGQGPVHVMTDAAGSLSRADAQALGVTLLDSYVNLGEDSLPETHLEPDRLWAGMRAGLPVSTSQASVFERHQRYEAALALHPRVLYLCVGSVYTGNHEVASAWQQEHDPEGRLVVLDSGAASGRLGIAARAVARYAQRCASPDELVAYARAALAQARERIFIDRLRWLAAGGRTSKGSAFFGDLLGLKPVISPEADGARKVAMVRSGRAQIEHALEVAAEALGPTGRGDLLVEHSDNREWLEQRVLPALRERFPAASLTLAPFSLTSGAHMGPGTWAVAALPELLPPTAPSKEPSA